MLGKKIVIDRDIKVAPGSIWLPIEVFYRTWDDNSTYPIWKVKSVMKGDNDTLGIYVDDIRNTHMKVSQGPILMMVDRLLKSYIDVTEVFNDGVVPRRIPKLN